MRTQKNSLFIRVFRSYLFFRKGHPLMQKVNIF